MTRCLSLACAGALILALTGCAGYRLGPVNGQTAGAHSVEIEPFANQTLQPHLEDYLMSSLRKSLQRDGTYRIETRREGDIVVSGVILSYQRAELSVQSADVITALDYEISLVMQVKARERSTGKIIFDRPVRGRTTLRAGNDLASAERQAMPLLADDAARKATALLADGAWWDVSNAK